MNPAEYFKDADKDSTSTDSSGLTSASDSNKFIDTAYELYRKWCDAGSVEQTFNRFTTSQNTSAADIDIKINVGDAESNRAYDEEWNNITNETIKKNINYVSDGNFHAISFGELTSVFETIIDQLIGEVFIPVSGGNDAGVNDSITYQDPIGEYMEIKNGAINTVTHSGAEAGTGPADYDMALLVFGKMHGLVRVGVYDWNWNDQYMREHDLDAGNAAFPMGWYHGNDPKTAEKALFTETDGSGSYPYKNNDETKTYANANAARADGWIFRLDYATLLQFVPITGVDATDPNLHPSNLPAQVKNTVYTCYRFAGTTQERNALHMNPIFGTDDDIPETLRKQWDAYAETGKYPDNDDLYAGIPGVYRLSDIRVWTEDTGDFVDTEGAIAPNGGYDRSLYLDVPAAVVPTQLATVTLGEDGVLSYLTNLATDKGIDYEAIKNKPETERTDADKERMQQYEALSAQSTPLRLFYAVGLEEDLILRDDEDNQIGVDFTKISPEYIQAHTDPETNYVYFISNYFSNTTYDDYVTGAAQTSRGDPTMTFSPSVENRYYIFQKPLPMYAHAYRQVADDVLRAVDNRLDYWRNWGDTPWDPDADWSWQDAYPNGGGNSKTTWEIVDDVQQSPGSWVGGEFMGTYRDSASFLAAKKNMTEKGGKTYITDDHGATYVYAANGIVFFEDDLLDHVTSDPDNPNGGYTDDSISFESDDYFFILVEYYLPEGDVDSGVDRDGKPVEGSYGGRMVQRVVARKGSEFGSGFVSDQINNGDMLCWSSMDTSIDVLFDYLSRSATGDLTRGEPTFEKLTTKDEAELEKYLTEKCGIDAETTMPNPDYDPTDPSKGEPTVNVLDYQVQYWLDVQENAQIQAALTTARAKAETKYPGTGLTAENFNEFLQFAVSAKPGGIRSGNMANNVHVKGPNTTGTAQNYYVPVVSANSGIGDQTILNNYMGNNGRMAIANEMLHVSKLLENPAGFELVEGAENEEFNYQIFVEGVSGTRSAILTEYNEYGNTWERKLAYIDVLTDNSDLVLDNDSNRAVFISDTIEGTIGKEVQTAKQVIANGVDEEGNPIYYEANEDGTLTFDKDGSVDTEKNPRVDPGVPLYYLYLPSNGSGDTAQHVRRLYQNPDYTDDAYEESDFVKNGTTTFYKEDQRTNTGTDPGAENRNSFRETNDDTKRPAGTITYWAQDAELIPVTEVHAAEATNSIASGDPAAYALMAVGGGTTYETDAESSTPGVWTHSEHMAEHEKAHVNLTYDTFVIRKPAGETSMTAFESPFKTRTQYMTVDLVFGKNANEADGSTTEIITEGDVYDQNIPSADQTALFGDITLADIASHTAEFTLQHGEGLLLSGLDHEAVYRFTEKLTAEQLAKGYTLKQIVHVQEPGSEETYTPGSEKLPNPYDGVYSVYGDTGIFEEQANYVNTVSPEMLVVTKEVVDKDGKRVSPTPGMVFSYTLELTDTGETTDGTDVIPALTGYDTIYLWKGSKDSMTSALTWTDDTDEDSPKEYTMPASAPDLNQYQPYIPTAESSPTDGKTYLQPLELKTVDGKRTCTFELRADEAAVFYGIPAGTNYTVTEAVNSNYPISDKYNSADPYSVLGSYTQTGREIKHYTNPGDAEADHVAMQPSETWNRSNFYNQVSTGTLTVEKLIMDDDAWDVENTFTFTVTLTAEAGKTLLAGDLTVTKFTKTKDGEESSETLTGVKWDETKDGDAVTALTATFELRHGQRFVVSGVPLGTAYTVAETDRDGYHLEYVVDGEETSDTSDTSKYQHPKDFGVSGKVDETTPQVYWLFANAKPASLPFSGGFGAWMFYVFGAVVLLAAVAIFAGRRRRGKRVI